MCSSRWIADRSKRRSSRRKRICSATSRNRQTPTCRRSASPTWRNEGLSRSDQLDTSKATAAALAGTIEADRAAVENARIQIQYTTITAPLTGRTGRLMVHEGSLIRANDTAPMVVINQLSPDQRHLCHPGGPARPAEALPAATAVSASTSHRRATPRRDRRDASRSSTTPWIRRPARSK